MRPFYLFKRSNSAYYVQFSDPVTGKRMTARSTGQKSYDAAMAKAYEWMYSGDYKKRLKPRSTSVLEVISRGNLSQDEAETIMKALAVYYPVAVPDAVKTVMYIQEQNVPVNEQEPTKIASETPFLDYLRTFWNYDESNYVRDKLNHGQKIGKRYCYEMENAIKYYAEFFSEDETVEGLTADRLRQFERYLAERHLEGKAKNANGKKLHKLSSATMNKIVKCCNVAFSWAVKTELIKHNPVTDLTKYSTEGQKRDILTPDEACDLFKYGTWENEMYKTANMVAMCTGLRLGEILSIRKCDIGEQFLYIRKSYNKYDGMKGTKTYKDRTVPIPEVVRQRLMKLVMENPHTNSFADGETLAFWGLVPGQPIDQKPVLKALKSAMYSIGITEEERKKRNVVFHSWRHFYATTMVNDVDEEHAKFILGHASLDMTKHYAAHERQKDLDLMSEITDQTFKEFLA